MSSIELVSRWVKRKRKRGMGDTWVVAVSGGGDSVGLLRVLHELAPSAGLRLSVAHLDHGVRGEASRRDAEFVAELAASLGLAFDLGHWSPIQSAQFESEARHARYKWLCGIAQARNATVVAVGHTLDDQAETILHRIVRGTGPRGLTGIPRKRILSAEPRIALVRPLLKSSRAEIRAYLAELGQPFCEDETNADVGRTRARIRHDLIPKLAAEYNPRLVEALVRLGELTAASQRAVEADARELEKASLILLTEDTLVLKHGLLTTVPDFLRAEVLRRVWRRAGWPERSMTAERWRRMSKCVRAKEIPRMEVGNGVSMSTENFVLVLRRSCPVRETIGSSPVTHQIALDIPGSVYVPWGGGRVEVSDIPGRSRDQTIDLNKVSAPLYLRPPLAGDRFAPLGMNGKSMPLADFLRGRRVPKEDRDKIVLVCDHAGIIWVVGHRIADRVKITDETRDRVGLSWVGD